MLWSLLQRLVAASLLVLLLPLFALLFLLVKCSSRGPFLFQQKRAGLAGKHFPIYKIRTMRSDGGPSRTLGVTQDHPAITRVGHALRELKLDELPQLWNVFRGDMAFVGPRPLPLPLDAKLADQIPGFRVRQRVRPGLTSVGQLMVDDNGVADRLIADWRARSLAERHYVRNRSFLYDALVMGLSALYLARKALRFLLPKARRPGSASEVLRVPIANVDYDDVVGHITAWREQPRHRYICICPVHSVVEARVDEEHCRALLGADLNTGDGMPVVWAQKLLGHRGASRVYGPELMLRVLTAANARGWRVGFYGSTPDVLERMTHKLQARYPDLIVACAISPPFRSLTPEEDQAVCDRIRNAKVEVLFVGLGCPRQEKWMAAHSNIATTMLGVGAAFDFHAGTTAQCPRPLQRIGLEWLFRLLVEPRRLFWRYARTNPEYVIRLTWQFLKHICGRDYQLNSDRQPAKDAA